MHDQPDVEELLNAVSAFLRNEAAPMLDSRLRFLCLVAANAIDIAAREFAFGSDFNAHETARLRKLLCSDDSLHELNVKLCAAIATDKMGPETVGLMEHLHSTTMERLAIDQPQYAAYRRKLGTAP